MKLNIFNYLSILMEDRIIYSDEHGIYVHNSKNIDFKIQSKDIKQICSKRNFIIILTNNNKILLYDIENTNSDINVLEFEDRIKQICVGSQEILILYEDGPLYIIPNRKKLNCSCQFILEEYVIESISDIYNFYVIETNNDKIIISIGIHEIFNDNNQYLINIIKYERYNLNIDIMCSPDEIDMIDSSSIRFIVNTKK